MKWEHVRPGEFEKALEKSNFNREIAARVLPQPGQRKPVNFRNRHGSATPRMASQA